MSLGGTQARLLRFVPSTGRASQRLVDDIEPEIQPIKTVSPTTDDIQFFED